MEQKKSVSEIRKELPAKLKKSSGLIGFAEDAIGLFDYLISSKSTVLEKVLIIGALGYFVLTFDAIPDFLGPAGFVDDAAVIAGAITALGSAFRKFRG